MMIAAVAWSVVIKILYQNVNGLSYMCRHILTIVVCVSLGVCLCVCVKIFTRVPVRVADDALQLHSKSALHGCTLHITHTHAQQTLAVAYSFNVKLMKCSVPPCA